MRNAVAGVAPPTWARSEEHTSELQSHLNLVCRLLLEKEYSHGALPLNPQSQHHVTAAALFSHHRSSHPTRLAVIGPAPSDGCRDPVARSRCAERAPLA